VSGHDSLFDGLTPLQAQAFHQNSSLNAARAIQLATDWVDGGDNHVDIAVLAAVDEPEWARLDFYFMAAMAARKVPRLTPREAAAIRLDHLLSWTRGNRDRVRDLQGHLIDHAEPLRRKAVPDSAPADQVQIADAIEALARRSDDFFDLVYSADHTAAKEKRAIAEADAAINELRMFIRSEFGHLLEPLN
jgi:hypothetical protein